MLKATRGVLLIVITAVLTGTLSALPAHSGTMGPYDVRNEDISRTILDLSKIRTLMYDETTTFAVSNRSMAESVLLDGMNPGLGIRQLHKQGITGKGVNVAIIDQNLAQDLAHPEYSGKIVRYADMGCNQAPSRGSFHGPAVTSLLVGTRIGTAPEASVFYAAAPSWTKDAKYQADALEWIIGQNRLLPANQKIRVVSISAAPSGAGSPFNKNQATWDAAVSHARQEGILVLDCTTQNGITLRSLYDYDHPEDVTKITVLGGANNRLLVPVNRTIAKEYENGKLSYIHDGKGGLSWTIPYVAGVLAMGWQVRPGLTADQMVGLLFESAFVKDGNKIINPTEFIKRVQSPAASTVKAFHQIPNAPISNTIPGAEEGKGLVDKIDLPFVDDPDVIGTWTSVDFVPDPGTFNPDNGSFNGNLYLRGLTFQPGGSTSGVWKWTRGVVIHEGDKTASKYEIRSIGGKKFLFLEWKSGDYVIRHMKPYYYVLVR
ncbi:MAG: hypothetical protein HQK89_17050 [Nitrospirae bacterium]|nr:hypothetical protein [Nitrospirota bacterium]